LRSTSALTSLDREKDVLLQESHQEGERGIMKGKTLGSQVGSLAVEADSKVEGEEEEGGSRRGWGEKRGAIVVVCNVWKLPVRRCSHESSCEKERDRVRDSGENNRTIGQPKVNPLIH